MLAHANAVEPLVIRNDELTWDQIQGLAFDHVVISPGPGRPERAADFGVCADVLRHCRVPVLGICLGHQGLAHVYGGSIIHAPEPMHGRASTVRHDGSALFAGIPQEFRAIRYHSLTVDPNLPPELEAIAWTPDGVLMGLRHRSRPLWGVQFHPESICTEYGQTLLDNFCRMSQKPERSVTFRKLDAFIDPEAVFCHLFGESRACFWLDSSVVNGETGRFSFMGEAAEIVPEVSEFSWAEARGPVEGLPFSFCGGYVGYFAYECDARFLLVDRMIAFDHRDRQMYLVCCVEPDALAAAEAWIDRSADALAQGLAAPAPVAPLPPVTYTLARSRERYLADIGRCQQYIRDGESYELCLTNKIRITADVDPLSFYRRLRSLNGAPFSAFLRFPELTIASSSPERFLRVEPDGRVESKPIKGTVKRGATAREDERALRQLRESEKDRAENLMIVDLVRNDLGRVCQPGTVEVPKLMDVETYATVHQMVSTVRGKLRDERNALDAVRAAFPGGSMTGAPKLRTMALLAELEGAPRGVYSGALGYLGFNGCADFSMVIRTAVFAGNQIEIGTGGAIVSMSDPVAEYEETLVKAQAVLQVFENPAAGT